MNLMRSTETDTRPAHESTGADTHLQDTDKREHFAQSLSDPDGSDPRMSGHGSASDPASLDWIGL